MFENFFKNLSLQRGYLSIIGGIISLFILGLFPNTIVWLFVKFLFFGALLSFVYLQYQFSSGEDFEENSPENLPEFEEDEQEWLQIESDQDVEEIFERFLDNSLQLIKSVLVTDTVVLLFANYSKKLFTVRYKISDNEDQFIAYNSFDILKGLPSLVLRNRTALIENHLPQSPEILPYYRANDLSVNSYMGVPIHFNNMIIGVLCCDSHVEEAYSNEDLEILKEFSKLISTQLVNSNKLYEYETENWVVNVLFDVSNEMNGLQEVPSLWKYLAGKLPEIVECDRVSIARKLDDRHGEIVQIRGGTGNLKPNKKFPLNEGIIGWVLRKNQPLRVEDFSSKDNYVPRFSGGETPAKDYLSLLAVPIRSDKVVLGAICLESYQKNNFKDQQKRVLETIANQAATVYNNAYIVENLKKLNYKDIETELENINAFRFVIPREANRARTLKLNFSLLFLKIYFQVNESEIDLQKTTVREFLNLILPNIGSSDYIFRLSQDTFVIAVLSGEADGLGKIAEKLLTLVKNRKVWANGQAFDFYANAAIVPGNFISADTDETLARGNAAVKAARLQGPNTFLIYDGTQDQTEAGEKDSLKTK